MLTLNLIGQSLSLLSRRDRVVFALITLTQVALSVLDLLGVLLIGVVSVLSVASVSGNPLPAQAQGVVDLLGFSSTDPVTIAAWLIGTAGLALILKSLLSAILARTTLRFLATRQAALSARLTALFLERQLLDIQARTSQDAAFGLTVGVQAATVGILGSTSAALADIGLLILLGVGLTAIDPLVTLYAVVFFGALGLILQRSLAGRATRLGRESADVDIESYTAIQQAIASYREITVAGRRDLYVQRIQRLRWRSAEIGAGFQFLGLIPKYVFEAALVVGAFGLAISQFLTKDVTAAVGIVAVFLVAGSRVMPALMRLQVTSLTIRQSEAAAERATSLAVDLESGNHETSDGGRRSSPIGAAPLQHIDFQPTIEVEDVSLTYPGMSAPAVAGVGFKVGAGQSIALVGSTGAGKSSVADLVLGLVKPDSGQVRIGGIEPPEAIERWPGGLAYVPQEVSLISGSIRENVGIGLPSGLIDDELAWEALSRAHLADFLRDGRDGLDTYVGEFGMRLSGGQRQRLGIARALYTRPRLLVLDEATSALDAETEDAIGQTMRELEGRVTTLTIAHRLATVRRCDLVVFLEAGRIAASGSFDEVRNQSQAFDRQARLLGL
ncbi:ABC transporter ATP-binding protein/permease [bacterium]|nr:ABC transporter ATP-binding protein/permease [bacterium]